MAIQEELILSRAKKITKSTSWLLRVTEMKDYTGPVLVIKERVLLDETLKKENIEAGPHKTELKDRGLIYGQSLRTCLPVIKEILSHVMDSQGVPLELHQLFQGKAIKFRGNIPLDGEAGPKLALIFKLQERLLDQNRVELIAWRVERFSREEAAYWLSRITHFGAKANLWAQSGLRIMLGGQPKDPEIDRMLTQLRR